MSPSRSPDGYIAWMWFWVGDGHDVDVHGEGPFDTLDNARKAARKLAREGWDGHEAAKVTIHEITYLTDAIYPPRTYYDVDDFEVEEILPE